MDDLMNPFLLSPRERLSDWKQLRTSLPDLAEEHQLRRVVHYWSQAPLVKFSHDPEDASSWPTMWEMITENLWCQNSLAIAMEQTLRLSGWDPSRLKLVLVKDRTLSDIMFVVQIDDRYWLNYEFDTLRDIPDTDHQILRGWQFVRRAYKEM
jgi:hypothetical protein